MRAAAVSSGRGPPDWPAVVAAHEPEVSVAFCLGNLPQLVRNLHPLLTGGLTAMRTNAGRPVSVPALSEGADEAREPHARLLAAGALRLARQFDQAGEVLGKVTAPEWQAFRANEEAALAWHRGQAEDALRMWQALEPSVPVLFNRGMAALFGDRPQEARPWLIQAVGLIPEDSPWHHLGRLYLGLTEMHG